MKKRPNILIGADPEVFVKNAAGEYVSGHGLIPGTKEAPHKVPMGAVQVDGMALEFNIDPADSAEKFEYHISSVFGQLKAMVPGLILVADPVATFTPDYFKTVPDDAKALGCTPDFDAWKAEANNPPDNQQPMRTAAGHIHIGWTKDQDPYDESHFEDCCTVVKELDYYLGLYSLVWDKDTMRRKMYGRAGCFRPKPYGVEYRTMSNVWLRDPMLIKYVFNVAQICMTKTFSGDSLEAKFGDFPVDVINESKDDWYRTKTGVMVMRTIGHEIPKFNVG